MKQTLSKTLYYMGTLCACLMMAFNTGCASGGFKLTREYSGWVNSKNVILRVILYLLTGVVYAITLLIDMVIFNTMDFWQGKVSQGDYQFKDEGKTYFVKHEFIDQRKQSTIRVVDSAGAQLEKIVLRETTSGDIELYRNDVLRSRVKDLSSIPVAYNYDDKGQVIQTDMGLWGTTLAQASAVSK